jgi:hypothetical protein
MSLSGLRADDELFEGINRFAPNLKKLSIGSGFKFDDKLMYSLAELTKLTHLSLNSYKCDAFQQLTDSGVSHLINSCHTLGSIQTNCVSNITRSTIDSLIAKAVNNPKKEFYIDLGRDPKTIKHSNQEINALMSTLVVLVEEQYFCSLKEELKKYKELPKNLKIKIEFLSFYFKQILI